jgi:hypothetical protein
LQFGLAQITADLADRDGRHDPATDDFTGQLAMSWAGRQRGRLVVGVRPAIDSASQSASKGRFRFGDIAIRTA